MIAYIEFQTFRHVCIRIYRSIKISTILHQFRIVDIEPFVGIIVYVDLQDSGYFGTYSMNLNWLVSTYT